MANKLRENRFRTFLKFVFEKLLFGLRSFNLFLRNSLIDYPQWSVNKLLISCVYLTFTQSKRESVDKS